MRERDMHVLVFCLPLPKVELLQLAASVCTKPSSKVPSKMKALSFSSQLHCKPILASVEVDFLPFCANLATFFWFCLAQLVYFLGQLFDDFPIHCFWIWVEVW